MSAARPDSHPPLPSRDRPIASDSEPSLGRILACLAGFVLLWTLYAAITEAPVALKHDMAEAYAWGRQFQWGYNQHPPFWAWICGLWFRVLPRQLWAFAALSSLNAGIGLWGAWAAMGEFVTGRTRTLGLALLLITPLYTFYAYKYDANTIFLSVWPWMLVWFLRTMRTLRTRDGIFFGIATACAILSKYYAAILIVTCLLASLQMPNRWRLWRRPAPYAAIAVALALIAPHLVWLARNNAPPLRYLASVEGWGWSWVLAHAANAPASALGMMTGPILVLAWVRLTARPRTAWGWPGDPRLRLLATLTFAPLILSEIGALGERTTLTSEMLLGTFPLLPLVLLALAAPVEQDRVRRITLRLAALVNFGAVAVAPVTMLVRTYVSPAAMKIGPYQEVARAATRIWHQRTGLPLRYVAGTHWYENEVAFYSADRPHAFKDFNYAAALWVTPARIARDGLLSVCVASDPQCLARTARFATPATTRTTITLARHFLGHTARPVRFVITVIPPRISRSARPDPG